MVYYFLASPTAKRLPNTSHFEVGVLTTMVPRLDLLRKLEDERDAFLQTLRQTVSHLAAAWMNSP